MINLNIRLHLFVAATGLSLLGFSGLALADPDPIPCDQTVGATCNSGCSFEFDITPFQCCNTVSGQCCSRQCLTYRCKLPDHGTNSNCPGTNKNEVFAGSITPGTCNGTTGNCEASGGGG